MSGAARNCTISVNFKKNNRLSPQAGRFGFLTEPDFTQKICLLQNLLESRRVYLLGVFAWVFLQHVYIGVTKYHETITKLTPMVRLGTAPTDG